MIKATLFVFTFALVVTLLLPTGASAGWRDWLKGAEEALGPTTGEATASAASSLSQGQITDGLKQALDVGVRRAIDLLGRSGGYLNDPQVRIPMPERLQSVEKGLRAVGKDALADEFVTTMNHAAEQAVPETVSIFSGAIREMSLTDARAILNGPDDAATRYFREHTESNLFERILPIVQQTTESAGATSAYKRFTGKMSVLDTIVKRDTIDLDRYVTNRALDGLFVKLAAEEARIRQDPVARSTDLLKQVFGAVGK